MKHLLLRTALVFVSVMLGIQLAFMLSYAFYPKGTIALTNLITAVYNQLG
jgi:hypothetical protein